MKRILILLASLLVVGNVYALPPCPSSEPTDDSWTCYGTVKVGDIATYVGEFQAGKLHGQGALTFNNGEIFVGEFYRSKPWTGVLYWPDGTTVKANVLRGVVSIPN